MPIWKKTTPERYYDMFTILPPECMTLIGFLVGEPSDHRQCKISRRIMPRFAAFAHVKAGYLEALEPMTIDEFRAVKEAEIRIASGIVTAREIRIAFGKGPALMRADLVIPAGTRCAPCGDASGQYFIDDLAWLPPNMEMTHHDATYYGIRIDAADIAVGE